MTPSVTSGTVVSRASASGKADSGKANLSRTSNAAVWWLRPKQTVFTSELHAFSDDWFHLKTKLLLVSSRSLACVLFSPSIRPMFPIGIADSFKGPQVLPRFYCILHSSFGQ